MLLLCASKLCVLLRCRTTCSSELSDIVAVWRAVAEDFAPFDVDVTTIRPDTFTSDHQRVMISPTEFYGAAGGVSYVGVFGVAYYQPSWVFPQYLSNYAKYIWEAGEGLSTDTYQALQLSSRTAALRLKGSWACP